LLIAEVTNTWSPQTTGELQLCPGTEIFHATFSLSLHVSGSAGSSSATPACSPRTGGHRSLATTCVMASSATNAQADHLRWLRQLRRSAVALAKAEACALRGTTRSIVVPYRGRS